MLFRSGVFPPALPIGVVSSIDDGLAVVRPFVDFSRIEHVRLVDYGVGGTLPVSAPQPGVRRPAR